MKFLNVSIMPQTVYVPSKDRDFHSRTVIDANHSIELQDSRDIEMLRRLPAFAEVPDDTPTKDYRRSRMSL